MKAAVVVEPGKFEIMELPMPKIGDYEVLCQLRYGATCTATDLHVFEGCPWNVKYPIILGHESIGKVIEIGEKVRHYKPGDLVTRVGAPRYPEFGIHSGNGWGGYSEYGVGIDHWAIRADEADIKYPFDATVHQILPGFIDERVAPLFITLRETRSYINRLGIKKGEDILIIGSGANGLAYALHAKNSGLFNIIMIGNPNKADKAALCGVTEYFDYRDNETGKKIKEKYGKGFDVIIDAVGDSKQLQTVFGSLKNRGTYGIYGYNDFGNVSINPVSAMGSYFFYNNGYNEPETHQEITEYFMDGKIKPEAFIDVNEIYELCDIAEVFRLIKEKKLKNSKALIKLF